MREYLKRLRKEKGMTQQDVAAKLGIAQNTYSNLENGKRQKNIQAKTLYQLSVIFDKPLQEVYIMESTYKSINTQKRK